MSLAIDINRVQAVLLPDGWHDVLNASFEIDAYEFVWSGSLSKFVEEVDRDPLVFSVGRWGFRFVSADRGVIAGPLSAVLAVST